MSILESLFSKSIISPDTSTPARPIPQVAVNPSVANLVRQQMNTLSKESQQSKAKPTPAPEPMPVGERVPEAKAALPEFRPEVPMAIFTQPEIKVNANEVKVVETSSPKEIIEPVENLNAAEKVEEETRVAEVQEMAGAVEAAFKDEKLSGRDFVDIFLREVSDLVVAGQLLNNDMMLREKGKDKAKEVDTHLDLLKSQGQDLYTNIQSTLSAISSDENKDTSAILSDSVKKYGEYLATFESALGQIDSSNTTKDNRLLIQIQKRKAEVNALLKLVGGSEVFDTIKSTIQKTEKVVLKYYFRELRKKFPNDIPGSTDEQMRNWAKLMFSNTTKNLFETIKPKVASDPHGLQMLVQSGSVVDVLRRLVQEEVDEATLKDKKI